jgi:hypothetical protein
LQAFKGPVLKMRYEDLLSSPQENVQRLVRFVGLTGTPDYRGINHERNFAFLGNSQYERLAEEHESLLLKYEYSATGFA